MRNLSVNQTVVLIVSVVGLLALTALHDVDGQVTVPVIAAIAANALGYVNGKKTGRNEVAAEIVQHVTAAVERNGDPVPPATSLPGPVSS